MLPRRSPSVEGGPAGSEVPEATISAAPERLGGAVLGKIGRSTLSPSFAEIRLRVCSGRFLPSAQFLRFGRMAGELEAYPELSRREGFREQ